MILVAATLLLVALGLLAGGLAQGSAALQWGSFAASALAALALGVGELRRRRAGTDDREGAERFPAAAARRTGVGALVGTPAAAATGAPAAGAATTAEPEPAPAPPGATAALSELRETAEEPEASEWPEPAEWTGSWAAVQDRQTEIYDGVPAPEAPATGAHAAPEVASPPMGAHSAERPGAPTTGAHAAAPALDVHGEPPVEEVEVTDLLVVLDLTDEVLVVDEHPRYHLAGCPRLTGGEIFPMPMDEARTDGFTPCGICAPDRNLAQRERARRSR